VNNVTDFLPDPNFVGSYEYSSRDEEVNSPYEYQSEDGTMKSGTYNRILRHDPSNLISAKVHF
jgi:hypothetical protein